MTTVPRAWQLLSALTLTAFAAGQQQDQARLRELRDQKRAEPVFAKAPWLFDVDQAMAKARADRKLVFVYFAVSYVPCPPCEELENGALADPAFVRFADDVVLLLHVTSRVDGEPHGNLLRDKGFAAFPTLCLLSPEGDVLATILEAEQRTVPAFNALHARARTVFDLRGKAKGGDRAAAKDLFLAELDLDLLTIGQVQERAAAVSLNEPEKVHVAARLTDLEVRELLARSRDLGTAKVEALIAEMARAGRRPTAATAESFWWTTLTYAANKRDAALAQSAYDELSRRFGRDKRYEKMLPRWRKLLEQAKAK
ncbi:MAG: thioredoxin family protein [Planctomycetes bacterium]|nr:thioredoxin family protein [Planctomycetota bacterium]